MISLVWIVCITSSLISITTGVNVRLIGGGDHSGTLEVFLDGSWGPVCDDSFGNQDSRVVCNELEYNDFTQSTYSSVTGSTGVFKMDNVACAGDESSIIECNYSPIDNCGTMETIYISCAFAGGDGCLPNPPCSTPAEDCPHGETEVVAVSRTRCPICRCASCPSQPACPTTCNSGRTEYFQDTLCRRCRCVAQKLPDVIEETATISTPTVIVISMVTLGIPVVILVVVIVIKRQKASKLKAKTKVRPRNAALVTPQKNNWLTGGGVMTPFRPTMSVSVCIRPRDPNLVAPQQNNWFAGGGVKGAPPAAMGMPMGGMVPPPTAMFQPEGVMEAPPPAQMFPGAPPAAQMYQPVGVMGAPPAGVMDLPYPGNPMFSAMLPQN